MLLSSPLQRSARHQEMVLPVRKHRAFFMALCGFP